MALQAACSISATSAGVANTGSWPLAMEAAVFLSLTTHSAVPTCIFLSFPGAGKRPPPRAACRYLRISAPKLVSSALRILSMLACISASVSVRSLARKVSA